MRMGIDEILETIDEFLKLDNSGKKQKEPVRSQNYRMGDIVWNVTIETEYFPLADRNLPTVEIKEKKEFKFKEESSEDYITRIVRNGKVFDINGTIYVIKDKIALEFKLDEKDEEVGYHNSYLSYTGWIFSKSLINIQESQISKPNRVWYSS